MKSDQLPSSFLCANLIHPIAEDIYLCLSNVYGPHATWSSDASCGRPLTPRGREWGRAQETLMIAKIEKYIDIYGTSASE